LEFVESVKVDDDGALILRGGGLRAETLFVGL
jgi:hypothetical protein